MIELSSEARKAYEVMIANFDKTSAAPLEVSENQLNADSASEQTETEEPEYSECVFLPLSSVGKVFSQSVFKSFSHFISVLCIAEKLYTVEGWFKLKWQA